MTKSSSLNNGIFTTSQFLITTFSLFFLYSTVLTFLGQNELGIWSMIVAIPTAMTVFGSGVAGCILRNTPKYLVKADNYKFSSMLATGLVVNLFSAICLILAGYILSTFILKLMLSESNVSQYETYFILAIWNVFFKYLSVVVQASLDGMQKFKSRSIINSSASILQIIFTIPSVYYFGLLGVFLLQLAHTIIVLIMSSVYLLRTNLLEFKYLTPSYFFLKLFLFQGKNFQLISFSIILFEPVSKYFIKKYTNYDIVSLYDISMRATSQIHSIMNAGIQVIIPRITEMETLENLDLKTYFLKAHRLVLVFAAILYTLLNFVFINGATYFDIENNYLFATGITGLSLAYMLCVISIVPYSILLGIGNSRIVFYSHLISTFLNGFLYYILPINDKVSFLIFLPPVVSIFISSAFLEIYFMKKYEISMRDFKDELFIGLSFIIFNIGIYKLYESSLGNIILVIESFLFVFLIYRSFKLKSINDLLSHFNKKLN
jgi:O-antigen/teichoic acid export membrane protein